MDSNLLMPHVIPAEKSVTLAHEDLISKLINTSDIHKQGRSPQKQVFQTRITPN